MQRESTSVLRPKPLVQEGEEFVEAAVEGSHSLVDITEPGLDAAEPGLDLAESSIDADKRRLNLEDPSCERAVFVAQACHFPLQGCDLLADEVERDVREVGHVLSFGLIATVCMVCSSASMHSV